MLSLVVLGIVSLLLLLLLLLFQQRECSVLFIDAPDPDNPAAAMALWSYVLKKKGGHLHLVLTGRPVNLRTRKRFSEHIPTRKQISRQNWETVVPEHARRVLEDSACRITKYLMKCGVPLDSFTLYDGGVARRAPLSDVAHDWDFIFDRRDLVTQRREDEGEILDPQEYEQLVDKYSSLSEAEREQTLLSFLRRYNLASLDDLRSHLSKPWNRRIAVFLGGPATALVKLFHGRAHLSRKVSSFYAMFGSLRPGKGTLLANQFNAACDLPAAKEVFVNKLFPGAKAHLITTETAKLSTFVLSAQEMAEVGVNDHVVRLQRLWEWTHGNRPQPMFDVLPVMAALPMHKDCFTWREKRVCMVESGGDSRDEIFTLVDTADSTESSDTALVSDECAKYDKESFKQFFAHIWR
jgi:hypothetical protein